MVLVGCLVRESSGTGFENRTEVGTAGTDGDDFEDAMSVAEGVEAGEKERQGVHQLPAKQAHSTLASDFHRNKGR
eukprot:1921402-Rhodomonas_salina.2